MSRYILFLPLLTWIPAAAAVVNCTPGSLAAILSETGFAESRTLTVNGCIDARDLVKAASIDLDTLDLSGVSIAAVTARTPILFDCHSFVSDELPDYIFLQSPIKSIILPASIKHIGTAAFAESAVENVEVPEGVTTIGDFAFRGCQVLTSVKLPKSITSIGKECFAGCVALTSLDMSKSSITEIPERMIAGCSALEVLMFPESVRAISPLAFDSAGVKSIRTYIPTEVSPFAIAHSSAITYPNLQISNAREATGIYFESPNVTGMEYLPDYIPAAAFAGSAQAFIETFAKEASGIGDYAFYDIKWTAVSLSSDLTALGEGVFANAGNIERISVIDLADRIPAVSERTFTGMEPSEVMLVVDNPYIDIWKEAPIWNEFNIVPASDRLDDVWGDTFSVRYSNGVLSITAPGVIEAVTVADEAGRSLATARPGTAEAQIAVTPAGGHLLIVTTSLLDKTRTDKILIE